MQSCSSYSDFLKSKRLVTGAHGPSVENWEVHSKLFPFQRDLVRWACKKGRCAIFADTGLGKTFMQIEFARLIGKRALIVAPLSVAKQTIREAMKIGVEVRFCRSSDQAVSDISITNYEMVEAFDPSLFDAVVLDESSILKGLAGKTRRLLTDMFSDTPYRLCCSATPAPNDIAEIANHAEFLGVMRRADMLSSFFVHDSNTGHNDGWRLKGHAEEAFYRWLASWSCSVKRPSDIGYEDDGFILPPLRVTPVFVKTAYRPAGALFHGKLHGIQDRASVRRATMEERLRAVVQMVRDDADQWILWVGLNDEGRILETLIIDSVLVEGSQSIEQKTRALEDFQDGKVRVLVTKGRIAGFGLNFQNCHKMAFVGLSDSWELYYQCIRRSWRFGQQNPVEVTIVLSEAEVAIYENVMHKEQEAQRMSANLIKHIAAFEKEELMSQDQDETDYLRGVEKGEGWKLTLGDSTVEMAKMETDSVDLSVFSPPFLSLYAYSPTARDLGNSLSDDQFFEHFRLIIRELLRVTKPGRNACVHVFQVPATLIHDGFIGLKDFRGDVIRAFVNEHWIYHGEVCIDKDPQAQAIRTHAKGLLFVQMRRDSAWLRQALADYILVFKKPGENETPVATDLTNEDWIEWARPVWYRIKETETLNGKLAKEDKDERHIAPLQLETIERCIRLWSNKEELVFSPFAGIGSEGYMALKLGRKFSGIELKPSYWKVACENLALAAKADQPALFPEMREVR